MDYRDYLDKWELRFGNVRTGEYDYWIGGRRYCYSAHRLTEAEFNEHIKELNDASADFDEAVASEGGELVKKALADAFPHELALLI